MQQKDRKFLWPTPGPRTARQFLWQLSTPRWQTCVPLPVGNVRNADQPYHDKPFSCAMGATESGVLSLKRVASCCWTGVASIVCDVGMFGLAISELVDEHRYRCLTQPTTSIGADTAGAAIT